MEDAIEEELQIAKEQDSEPTNISAKIFQEKIKTFNLKRICSIKENTLLKDAVTLMQSNNGGSILIVDEKNQVKGILTERDILMKVLGKEKDWENVSVNSVMTPGPLCLHEEDKIAHVMHNMHIGGYRHIPILNEKGHPVHMVSIKDVISFVFEQFPTEIDNILDEPFRGEHVREGA